METRSLKGKLALGTEVTITNLKFPDKKAKVLFVGEIAEQTGEWIGVELLGGEKGNHSGSLKGKSYFTTGVPGTGIFVRAKDAKLSDGKPLSELLEAGNSPQHAKKQPELAEPSKFGAKKDPKASQKQKTTSTKAPISSKKQEQPLKPPKKQKLQTQLQNLQQTQKYQQKIQQLQKEIKQLKESAVHKIKEENESLIARIKEVEQENHNLKISIERKVNEVDPEREHKLVELNSEIIFYKKIKEDSDREKKRLEARNAELESALDENAESQEIILRLNDKIEHLEGKSEALRTELEAAKTQLKNAGSGGAGTGTGDEKSETYLNEEISILNETVIILESQAKEDKDKIELLEKEISANSTKLTEYNAVEKKLKQREREVAELKVSLDQQVDAINFVEQLSLTKLRIEEELTASKNKINDLLNSKDLMEQDLLDQNDFQRELEHQITQRDIEIEHIRQQSKRKDDEIDDKVKQIGQYKDKIAQLLKLAEQNNNLAQMKAAREAAEGNTEGEVTVIQNSNQLMDLIKFSELINQKFIKVQNENILVRNKAGVFLVNLFQSLPEEFIQQFYPEALDSLILVKTAKDKTYYLFEWICTELREKNELYTDENSELINWMLLLLTRLQRAYYNLLRVDLLISNCENEEELGNIITHRGIRDQSVVLDAELGDLMNKFAENNVSSSYSFDRIDNCNQQLETECSGFNKVLSKDNETKLELCRLIMEALKSAYNMILSYKFLSELRENSQIDVGFDNYLKKLKEYLKEICLNNHFRYKPKMKNLIDDVALFKDTFKEIEADDNALLCIENISSSENETLKLLKESILSSQVLVKELLADLDEIELKDELHKIQGKLEGAVWGAKLNSMKEELLKVRQLAEQKSALEFDIGQYKKRVAIQEKELKDKNTVKDVLEKRIGELQLKAEEVTVLKNDKERLEVKIKTVEENNKVMEEEIENLIKKKGSIEEENKKMKESVVEQSAHRPNRTSLKQAGNLSYSLNSAPVLGLLKENSNLRNVDLKEKVSIIKFSDVMKLKKETPVDRKKPLRKQLLEAMVNIKIISPMDKHANNTQLELQKLFLEIDKVKEEEESKKDVRLIEVGTVRVWGGVSEAAGNTISVLGYSEMRNILPDLVKS